MREKKLDSGHIFVQNVESKHHFQIQSQNKML